MDCLRGSCTRLRDRFRRRQSQNLQRKHSVDGNENVGFEASSTDLNQIHKNERKSDGHKNDHEHSKVALGKILSLRNRDGGAFHFEDGKNEGNKSEFERREDSGKVKNENNSTTVSINTFETTVMEEENEMEVSEIVPYDVAEKQLEKGRDIEESDNEAKSGLGQEDCTEEFGDTEIYPYPDIYLTKVDCDEDDSVEIEVILSSNSPGSGARKYQGGKFIGEVARSMKGRRKKHSEGEGIKERSDEGLNAENEISEKMREEGISENDLTEKNNIANDTQISETAASESLDGSSRTQEEVEIDSNKRNETDLTDSLSNTYSKARKENTQNAAANPDESQINNGKNSSGTRTEDDTELGIRRSLQQAKDRNSSESDSCDSEAETSTGDQILAHNADRNKKPTAEVLTKGEVALEAKPGDVNNDEQEQSVGRLNRNESSSENEDLGEEMVGNGEDSSDNDSESDNDDDSESERESGEDNSDDQSETECHDEAGTEEHSEELDDSDNDETDDELEADNSSENNSDSGNEDSDDSEVDNKEAVEAAEHLRSSDETGLEPSTDTEVRIDNACSDDESSLDTKSRLETPLENDIQVTLIDDMPPTLTGSDTNDDCSTSTNDKKDAFRVI